jgi:hypothetical protein
VESEGLLLNVTVCCEGVVGVIWRYCGGGVVICGEGERDCY